jgi:hypothetical protein
MIMKNRGRLEVLGVGWYRRDQWALLKAHSVDAATLEDSYDEWLAYAERTTGELRVRGFESRRVDIDVEEMIRWCKAEGRALDGKARARFIALKTRDQTK